MLSRNELILAKIQPTLGTDSVPTGTDAVALANIVQANPAEGARFAERPVIRGGSIGKASPLFGGSLFSFQIEVEIKGSGAAGTAPEFGPLLRACGFLETIVASTSVTYTPRSSGHELVSIYWYLDGSRIRVIDCRGNVSFRGGTGEVVIATFNMTGRKVTGDPTDVAQPTPTLDTTVPPTFLGANFFNLDAYNPAFTEWTLDMQNGVNPAENANASDGYGEIRITERDPRGSINPEMTLVSVQDWLDDWEQGTTQDMNFQLGSAGNQFQFSLPIARYIEPSMDDRDGTRVIGMGYKADESSSLNDEVSIAFT